MQCGLCSLLDDTSKLGLHLARREEDDKLWLPFIKRLKKADTLEDYNIINTVAESQLGLSLLEFSLSTGRLSITKVCFLMTCAKFVCNVMHCHSRCLGCCEFDFETTEVDLPDDNSECSIQVDGCCEAHSK